MERGKRPTINDIRGCPVADGRPACVTTCGGNWPGTRVTTENMIKGVESRRINPDKLGCGILQENAKLGLEILNNGAKTTVREP